MEYEINQEKLDLFRSMRPAAGDEQRKTAAANMCKPFVTILEGGDAIQFERWLRKLDSIFAGVRRRQECPHNANV